MRNTKDTTNHNVHEAQNYDRFVCLVYSLCPLCSTKF